MGLAKVKKVYLIGHKNIKDEILDILQDLGCVHIESSGFIVNSNFEISSDKEMEILLKELSDLSFCINFLKNFEEEKSFKDKIFKSKKILSFDEMKKISETFDYKSIIRECKEIDSKIKKLEQRKKSLENEILELLEWQKIDYPLAYLNETKRTYILIGEIKEDDFLKFSELIKDYTYTHFIILEKREKVKLMLFVLKEEFEELSQELKGLNFERKELPKLEEIPLERINRLYKNIENIEREISNTLEDAKKYTKYLEKLMIVHDYKLNLKGQKEVKNFLYETTKTFFVEGWVVEDDIKKLKTSLSKFKEIELFISNPKDIDPPVYLKNPKIISPFEIITNLYSTPAEDEIDPTPLLAPFFMLFFGLCLTDAGYGVLIALITYLLFRKMVSKNGLKKLLFLFFLCALATIFCGAITGGWFGDIIDKLPFSFLKELKNSIVIFNPIENPLTFMLLALALGFIQVWFAIAIKAYQSLRKGDISSFVFDGVSWFILLFGAVFLIIAKLTNMKGSLLNIVQVIFLLGAIIIILFHGREHKNPLKRIASGIIGLYGLVGYFSDILSYSRLLALGLATSVIAIVINTLSFMISQIPYIGFIFTILVFIGGHIFNLLINTLGAFVHTSRLQFVEFLPKFFKGGGKLFTPFKREEKYILIKSKI